MAQQSLGATPHPGGPVPSRVEAATGDSTAEQFRRMLRGSLVPTLVAGAVVVALSLLAGAREAGSASLGVLLVVVFFSLSLVVMARTAHLDPTAVMVVVLASYTAKIVALGVVMVVLRDATWLSGQVLAISIVVCTLVWMAFELRAFTRLRVLVTDDDTDDAADPAADDADETTVGATGGAAVGAPSGDATAPTPSDAPGGRP